MKRILPAILMCVLAIEAPAQSGSILYQETTRIDIELPPQMAHLADQIPDSRSISRILLFNESQSLIKNGPEIEPEEGEEAEPRNRFAAQGGRMMFRMGGNTIDNQTWTGLESGEMVEKRNFMGRDFLIDGNRPDIKWKMTGETSQFEGYMTMKATAMVDTVAVEAWFAPQIPVPAGPDGYGGLPGVILVLTEDEGRKTWVAKQIAVVEDIEAEITRPTEGRKVTREEFDAIVEEKRKEMEAQMGGRNGGVRFRVN